MVPPSLVWSKLEPVAHLILLTFIVDKSVLSSDINPVESIAFFPSRNIGWSIFVSSSSTLVSVWLTKGVPWINMLRVDEFPLLIGTSFTCISTNFDRSSISRFLTSLKSFARLPSSSASNICLFSLAIWEPIEFIDLTEDSTSSFASLIIFSKLSVIWLKFWANATALCMNTALVVGLDGSFESELSPSKKLSITFLIPVSVGSLNIASIWLIELYFSSHSPKVFTSVRYFISSISSLTWEINCIFTPSPSCPCPPTILIGSWAAWLSLCLL